jgi:hypothetical protein
MKNIYLVLFSFLSLASFGQTIPNGRFENWNVTNYDSLNGFETSNRESIRRVNAVTAYKSTDSFTGNALKLTTVIANGDTAFGYFINTNQDPMNGKGGVPYAAAPTAITGYYKYNLVGNDSAGLLVIFKKNGVVISMDVLKIRGTGTLNSWTAFSFPLSTLPVTPDSVILGGVSSNVFGNTGMENGSTLYLDELAFTGATAMPPIPNGNFENWTPTYYATPIAWYPFGESVLRSTDKYEGNYAIAMTTFPANNNNPGGPAAYSSGISNGQNTMNGPMGGSPYSQTMDTLRFFYKYIPGGTIDSAQVMMDFRVNGMPFNMVSDYLLPTSNFVEKKIPINLTMTPDTMVVRFESSVWPASATDIGSTLIVDAVELRSQPLSIPALKKFSTFSSYPSPATDAVNILSASSVTATSVQITDLSGRVIMKKELVSFEKNQPVSLDIENLPAGTYTITILVNSAAQSLRFVKQ